MAAKHDGKKARANHWVMQQNLAKQKGGRPGYQFTEKKAPKPAKGAVGPARTETARPAPAESAESTETGGDGGASRSEAQPADTDAGAKR